MGKDGLENGTMDNSPASTVMWLTASPMSMPLRFGYSSKRIVLALCLPVMDASDLRLGTGNGNMVQISAASHSKTNGEILAQIEREIIAPRTVLDIGCGKGALLAQIADMYRARDWPIDPNLLGVDIDISGFVPRDIPHRQMDLNRPLPFDDGTIDIVLAVEVLEHTRAPYLVIEEAKRILRPGGLLIFSVPNVGHALSRMSFLLNGHFHLYPTPSSDPAKGGTLAGHIEPLPAQYWHYGLRYAGFSDIEVRTDKSKRGAAGIAWPLRPLLALARDRYSRYMRRYNPDVAKETEAARSLANRWDILTGRTLIFSARRPA